jgi:hypothetical protein
LIGEKVDHGDHQHNRGGEFVVFETKAQLQDETNQPQIIHKGQQSHWDLAYEAPVLVDKVKIKIIKGKNDSENMHTNHLHIWEDALNMKLLTSGL